MISVARLVALAALTAIVGGCSPASSRAEAQQRWERRSDGDYVLSFGTNCDCPADRLVFDVVFREDSPVSATFTRGERSREVSSLALAVVPSVNELLALASEDAEFNEETGLPVEVRRGTVTYSDIRVRFDLEDDAAQIEAIRLVWEERGPDDYQLSYRCNRGCSDRGRVQVEWRDGELTNDRGTDGPSSVEELLELIEEALASSPASVDIRLHDDGTLRRVRIVDTDAKPLIDVRAVEVIPLSGR